MLSRKVFCNIAKERILRREGITQHHRQETIKGV
jgi:hypothetical protein